MDPYREALLVYLMKFIRLPYLWGGKDPYKGLDCSGLVWNILSDFQKALPNPAVQLAPTFPLNAQGLYEYYKIRAAVPIEPAKIDLGDLLFFGNVEHIHHVAMAVNEVLMIEAAHGDETITSIEIAKEKGAYVFINPISRFNDFFGALRLNNLPWS